MSVFQITIFFLYIIGGLLMAMSRLQSSESQGKLLFVVALLTTLTGVLWHAWILSLSTFGGGGLALPLGNTASLIGLLVALIALLGSSSAALRGLGGGLLIVAAFAALPTATDIVNTNESLSLQTQSHIIISLIAYGLLSVGAIVAVFALIQESRLRSASLGKMNRLFAPLETTEKLLFGISSAGFVFLLIAISSGFAFVEDLFAQHLSHKTVLSLIALLLFGLVLAGRHFAGWRGKRAIYLYLAGFVVLCLAYFVSRFVLEEVLGRSWS